METKSFYEEGWEAHDKGVSRNANPYVEDEEQRKWMCGWDDAELLHPQKKSSELI